MLSPFDESATQPQFTSSIVISNRKRRNNRTVVLAASSDLEVVVLLWLISVHPLPFTRLVVTSASTQATVWQTTAWKYEVRTKHYKKTLS